MNIRNLILLFLLSVWSYGHGQNKELESKLKIYFANLPILQSTDSILKFAQNDTTIHDSIAHYKIIYYPDSIHGKAILDYHIYSDYYDNGIFYDYNKLIFYNSNTDTTNLYVGYFGISTATHKLRKSKMQYRRLLRKFSKYFTKTTCETNTGPFGGLSKSTFFYLNKNDTFPSMEVYWLSAADMSPNSYNIIIYKKD